MLVHMQQVNHSRHQYHAAADAQEAYQHADDKSQQENDRYHVIGCVVPIAAMGLAKPFLSSPVPPLAATSFGQAAIRKNACFFCLRGTCYIYMSFSRPPCGLLAPTGLGSRMRAHPRNTTRWSPARSRSQRTRSATQPMPIDRKPEFFKGYQLKVGIIGCGYVGLPLALRFAEAGHKVTGFDTDATKVNMLNAGKSYIEH